MREGQNSTLNCGKLMSLLSRLNNVNYPNSIHVCRGGLSLSDSSFQSYAINGIVVVGKTEVQSHCMPSRGL